MKDFAHFLKETHFQRQEMINLTTKKINETIQASKTIPEPGYDAGVSLSIFRSEMEIYHNWLMEQFAHVNQARNKP